MAIEFGVKVVDEFSVEALHGATNRTLATLLGPDILHAVIVRSDRGHLKDDHAAVSPQATQSAYPGGGSDSAAVVFEVDGGAIEISFDDYGNPEDEELGAWIGISAGMERTPASYVLAIASAISAARLSKSLIVDESAVMGCGRTCDPNDVEERLRLRGTSRDPVADLLERTRLQG